VFAAASLVAAIALLFSLGPVAHATNQTTARVVGAALLALACGAGLVARRPEGNRSVVWMEIVFMAGSLAAIAHKVIADPHSRERTWLLLGALAVGLGLLLWVESATRAAPADRPRR